MNAALFPDLIVNGEHVPHALVAAEAQNQSAPKGKPGIAWRKAANAIAIRTLLLQEASLRGVEARPEEVGPGRFETQEEALIRGLLDLAVDAPRPTEDEVRAEWAKDPSRYRAPPLWEVSHILLACDPRDTDARNRARARAGRLLEQVKADPNDFAKLARDHSDCGSAANGGALGQLVPGDTVPEFETALRSLSEGELCDRPVETRYGFHLIRMDGRLDGDVLPYETVRGKIGEAMEKANWGRAVRDFTNTLVSRAQITGAELKPL